LKLYENWEERGGERETGDRKRERGEGEKDEGREGGKERGRERRREGVRGMYIEREGGMQIFSPNIFCQFICSS